MVFPIRDLTIFDKIFDYLEHEKSSRDYMIVFLGVNTGLRISDLIRLTVFDFNYDHIKITCKKTGNKTSIPILKHVRKEIDKYIKSIPNNLYLFTPKRKDKPLSRQRAYEILKNIENKFKLDSLGTHTLRKTFGYHFYISTNDIASLMVILGHETERDTLKYIGITQDKIDYQMEKWGGIKRNRLKVIKWTK